MSDPGTGPGGPGGPGAPSEEELRAAYEAELARITAIDMIAQSAISLLNIGARRMGPPPGASEAEQAAAGRDLEQVRDAVDGARGLLAILERRIPAQELAPLKDALSRLQMAYAQELGSGGRGAAGVRARRPGRRSRRRRLQGPRGGSRQAPAQPGASSSRETKGRDPRSRAAASGSPAAERPATAR